MEKENWMHYCEEGNNKQLILCDIKDLKSIQAWKLNVPYESGFSFDTSQIKNFIYFTGGGNPPSEGSPMQFYQITMRMTIMPDMGTVSDKLANMNIPRANHTMEPMGDSKLYVIGGSNSSGYLSSCEEYNIATNKWREIASLNEMKQWVSVCSYKQRYFYAFGGCIIDESKGSPLIEFLDMEDAGAKCWNIVKIVAGGDLLKASYMTGVVSVADDCILIFGGGIGKDFKDTCARFDPMKQTIEKGSSLLKKDNFYRTKYGISNNTIAIIA